ncbi:MAG: malonate decarboxylase holo-[acyl-carrier-protein] synthase [Candidatus Aureabacteria bacterium]|nr:malonate decarboxylase holo-[acyl-carrier-protein] synthase [Candidatus Auribacterota bacterium]
MIFNRHYLARLENPREGHGFETHPHRGAIIDWFERRLPAVVCRSESQGSGEVTLGIHFPPGGYLRGERVSFILPLSRLASVIPPPLLAEVAPRAPGAWRDALGRLLAMSPACAEWRVYGSHMWRALTGEQYLRDTSDIDLLIPAATAVAAESVLEVIPRWERSSGFRADGEVIFPCGGAAAWRELLGGNRMLLVKSLCAVGLRPREEVFHDTTRSGAASAHPA